MAEDSRFFTAVGGDKEYSQADLAEVLLRIFTDGYFDGVGNDLEVTESTPNALTVDVDTGKGWVQGFYYENNSSKTVTLTTADPANPRIDRIVLRLSFTANRQITAEVLTGTPAGGPVAPTLTQNATTWEISLAQVAVAALAASVSNANITDERTAVTVRDGITAAERVDLAKATLNDDSDLSSNGYFLDEDDMSSDDDTKVSSQQAIKAFAGTKITSEASSATPTPIVGFRNSLYILTALSEAAAFAVPSGTPVQGDRLTIRIEDDATARALTWNAIYRTTTAGAPPSTTILSRPVYIEFIYNDTDTKWDISNIYYI